jgi:hypothetical protein
MDRVRGAPVACSFAGPQRRPQRTQAHQSQKRQNGKKHVQADARGLMAGAAQAGGTGVFRAVQPVAVAARLSGQTLANVAGGGLEIIGDLRPPPRRTRRRRRRLRRHPLRAKVARHDPRLAMHAVLIPVIGAKQVSASEASPHRLAPADVTSLDRRGIHIQQCITLPDIPSPSFPRSVHPCSLGRRLHRRKSWFSSGRRRRCHPGAS